MHTYIKDVGGAGTISVRQSNSLLIERVGQIKPWRIVHGDLATEASVTEIRPIADFSVPDANDVGQTVTRHVGQIDRLRAVIKHYARALLLMLSGRDAMLLSEALAQVRGMPSEGDILRDQDVGYAIASNVDKFEIGVFPVDDRQGAEGAEWLPSRAIRGALIESRLTKFEIHQIKVAVTRDIEKLLFAFR